jgi:phytoene dehydrogenase-like protein
MHARGSSSSSCALYPLIIIVAACCSFSSLRGCTGFLRPPFSSAGKSCKCLRAQQQQQQQQQQQEVDVIVIGSGIGGLSAAGLCAKYSFDTLCLESHYTAGGVAHSFTTPDGSARFDAGPSLWSGCSMPSTNPIRNVLDLLDEEVEWKTYTGWGMHLPEGKYFRFTADSDDFEKQLQDMGGAGDVASWRLLREEMRPLLRVSASIPAMALRGDSFAALALLPFLMSALFEAGPRVSTLTGPITGVLKPQMNISEESFLYRWIDYLAFALSGLPADGTQAAAVIYTIGDLLSPGAILDYPVGGSGSVVDAFIRGLEKHGGCLRLKSHVEEILVDKGSNRATGVRLRGGEVIRARRAVISNCSIWDTLKLVPEGILPGKYVSDSWDTPDTGSFMHLHLVIDGEGLDPSLDIHHSVISTWDEPIDAPLNMYIVSIPTVLDPGMAPPGKHIVHIYTAGNEPYSLWEGLKRGSPEYLALKKERSEGMWRALERIIPDIRKRVEVEYSASPLTHEYWNRRHRGSYGPGWKAGQQTFPGCITPIKDLLHCGDSTIPGLGLPAVAASGMSAANTLVSPLRQWALMQELTSKGLVVNRFKEF